MARGPPCPRPWPRRTESPLLVSVPDHFPSRSFAAVQRALSLSVVDTHSRAFRDRYRFHERAVRTVDGSTEEGRWNGDGDTGVGGLTDSSPQSLFLLHQRRLPILHSYYLARTTCVAVRSSRVDVWVGVCWSGGRAACRVRVEFARGGERIYRTFLPLLCSFFTESCLSMAETVRRNPCR